MKPQCIRPFCIFLLSIVIGSGQTVFPQSTQSRPRRVEQLAFNSEAHTASDESAVSNESASLDTLLPRTGLQFYLEVRGSGLSQLASSGTALGPIMKLLARPALGSASDWAAFAMGQMRILSSAKLAFVSYGADGSAALIEAANTADAESLRAGVTRLLGSRASAGGRGQPTTTVALAGRTVVAGEESVVGRLVEPGDVYRLGGDPFFSQARERFAGDPLFGYLDIGPTQVPAMPNSGNSANDSAYRAGAMAAELVKLGARPTAIAMGGRIEGDTLAVRALMFMDQTSSGNPLMGLFSSLTSGATSGEAMAAGLALPDTDLFVDFRVDWDKLYQSLEGLFTAFTNSQAGASDPLAATEQSLGFSIRNDLLPTLGSEIAISLSGAGAFFSAGRATSRTAKSAAAARPASPRFMLMVALKNSTRFEQLVSRLINKPGAPMLSRAAYRGAIVSSNKSVAFAVTRDFFVIGGSAAEIRRALDAYYMGNSLAVAPEFRAALGDARATTMQLYLSSAVATKLFEALQTATAKASGSVKELAQPAGRVAGLGISMRSDKDGVLLEMRAPVNLALAAMGALATGQSVLGGMTPGAPAGFGIPGPTPAAPGIPGGVRRATPKMTEDDLAPRRP